MPKTVMPPPPPVRPRSSRHRYVCPTCGNAKVIIVNGQERPCPICQKPQKN